jgi:hypothetical protein
METIGRKMIEGKSLDEYSQQAMSNIFYSIVSLRSLNGV